MNLLSDDTELVFVRWVDSIGGTGRWLPIEEITIGVDLLCESVGWLVGETEDHIVVAGHIHGELSINPKRKAVESACGEMVIPKTAIIERHTLKLPGQEE